MEIKTANSLGMNIITALTDQIEGTLNISRENGTEFRIIFKESILKT